MPQTLLVESTQYGWWYVAPFSSDEAIVCLMSDVDILRKISALDWPTWRGLWLTTRLARGATLPEQPALRLHVSPCESTILTKITGQEWVAIGDAAAVFDPLASAGVIKAIHDGRLVGDAIHEYLSNGSVVHLQEYAGRMGVPLARVVRARPDRSITRAKEGRQA